MIFIIIIFHNDFIFSINEGFKLLGYGVISNNCNFGGNVFLGERRMIIDLFDVLLINMKFFVNQSCGKCAPCREGHVQIVNLLNKFINHRATEKDLMSLENLANVIQQTSLCGLGQSSMTSIISSLRYFRDDYFSKVRY